MKINAKSVDKPNRRKFIKLASLTIGASTIAPLISIPLTSQTVSAQGNDPATPTLDSAQSKTSDEYDFIFSSPMLRFILEQLKSAQFVVERVAAEKFTELDAYQGLRLINIESPNRRTHADVFCVVDPSKKSVQTAQLMLGQSLEFAMDVYSVIVDDDSFKTTTEIVRDGFERVVAGYKQEVEVSFPRGLDEILPPPDPLPLEGWPADDGKQPFWVYGRSTKAEWSLYNGKLILRGATVVEAFSADTTRTREFPIPYPTQRSTETKP